jgi:hypothetical protein
MADAPYPVPTYGNWRRPTSPGLGRLGTLPTVVLLGSIVVAVIASMIMWQLALAVVGFTVVVAIPLVVSDRHGRNGFQWAFPRLAFARSRRLGENLYRSGPLARTAHGRHRLPGIAAALEVTEALDAWRRPFVLLHHPRAGHVTTVLSTTPDGAALVDDVEVDNRVAQWGAWLASLAYEPSLVAAAITVETAPDTGARLRREVEGQRVPDAPMFAADVMDAVVDRYPAGSAQITCRIALTWSTAARPGGGRRTVGDMAVEIGHRLPGLTRSLGATGAGSAAPMTAAELAAAVRVAYDPACHELIEAAGSRDAGIELADAGPAAQEESWDHLRHDSGVSVTWTMAEAPTGHVFSTVLGPLLAPHRDIARKRVTLIVRPHDPASAARVVEQDRLDAMFQANGKRLRKARDGVSLDAAAKSASEEAQGAGVVRFSLVATATVLDPSDLDLAAVGLENLATTARIGLRRAYGFQASAFLAGLPLGLVLPAHLRIPQSVRTML